MEIRAVEAQRTAVESAAEIMDQLLGLGLTGAEVSPFIDRLLYAT